MDKVDLCLQKQSFTDLSRATYGQGPLGAVGP